MLGEPNLLCLHSSVANSRTRLEPGGFGSRDESESSLKISSIARLGHGFSASGVVNPGNKRHRTALLF
jgi:hypothetical protein